MVNHDGEIVEEWANHEVNLALCSTATRRLENICVGKACLHSGD